MINRAAGRRIYIHIFFIFFKQRSKEKIEGYLAVANKGVLGQIDGLHTVEFLVRLVGQEDEVVIGNIDGRVDQRGRRSHYPSPQKVFTQVDRVEFSQVCHQIGREMVDVVVTQEKVRQIWHPAKWLIIIVGFVREIKIAVAIDENHLQVG